MASDWAEAREDVAGAARTNEACHTGDGTARAGRATKRPERYRPGASGNAGGQIATIQSRKQRLRERALARMDALHDAEVAVKRSGVKPRRAEDLGEGMQQAIAVAIAAHGVTHSEISARSGFAIAHITKALSRQSRMSLDCFATLLLALPEAAQKRAMAEVCGLLGGSFVPAGDDHHGVSLPVQMLLVGGQLGSLQEAAGRALEDGTISEGERRVLRERASELASRVETLLSRLDAV